MMTVPHIGLKDPAERFTTFRARNGLAKSGTL